MPKRRVIIVRISFLESDLFLRLMNVDNIYIWLLYPSIALTEGNRNLSAFSLRLNLGKWSPNTISSDKTNQLVAESGVWTSKHRRIRIAFQSGLSCCVETMKHTICAISLRPNLGQYNICLDTGKHTHLRIRFASQYGAIQLRCNIYSNSVPIWCIPTALTLFDAIRLRSNLV